MKMTTKRKSLQDKLRRKFGWHTNNNSKVGRTRLHKLGTSHDCVNNKETVTDIYVYIHDYQLKESILNGQEEAISIWLVKYIMKNGERWKRVDLFGSCITLEELELIYKIAKEKVFEVCSEMSNLNEK